MSGFRFVLSELARYSVNFMIFSLLPDILIVFGSSCPNKSPIEVQFCPLSALNGLKDQGTAQTNSQQNHCIRDLTKNAQVNS